MDRRKLDALGSGRHCHENPVSRGEAAECRRSCGKRRSLPLLRRVVSEDSQCRPGNEVALNVERIVDGSMEIEMPSAPAGRRAWGARR